ncbi:11877_t:CDS:1 [Funneliformis geosporum]|uniref:13309_t:CDS:1 n=1 Tax=Funneliformis geosporum TaxID=1117311 RepID=A0A9W4WU48_9GLOM|nr:11877_t:CDS:1 [Funneliformis geosporum]CAI2172333.1 13309_t:CDS:1 [Funneliformis geosporum]
MYEELSRNDPLTQTSQLTNSSSNKYTLKLCIVIVLLIIWSAAQGIISFHIGSNFNSPCLIAFGISSFAQIVIILYIYHKILTEHYERSRINNLIEAIELFEIESHINSRKKTEKFIIIFDIIIFMIFATITTFIAFYVKDQEKYHKKPLPPGTIPPLDDTNDDVLLPLQLLAFSVYVLHPYLIIIPSLWYLSISKQSEVLKEATVWAALFFSVAYLVFINCQLVLFIAWKLQEVVFTLIIAVMFVVFAANFGWIYWWRGKIEGEISYSNEIEDFEEEE